VTGAAFAGCRWANTRTWPGTSREAWLTRALTDLIDEREHRVLDEAVGLLNRLVEYEPDAKTTR
jgi:hypothetical protein